MHKFIRPIARFRAHFPLAFFTPAFLAGELVAEVAPLAAVVSIIVVTLILLVKGGNRTMPLILLASFLAGSALVCTLRRPALLPPEKEGEQSFLASVIERPRTPATGKLSLDLSLYAIVKGGHGGVEVERLREPVKAKCRTPHLPWRNSFSLIRGSVFVVRTEPMRIRPDGPFSNEAVWFRRGFSYTCKIRYASEPLRQEPYLLDSMKLALSAKVIEALGDTEDAGLLMSMAYGQRDVLSSRVEEAFRRTGLAHLLVFSGFQVTLIYYVVFALLRFSLGFIRRFAPTMPRDGTARVGAIAVSALWVFLAGIEGSSLRALVALLVVAVAAFEERRTDLMISILDSLLILNILYPCAFLEPGVQLTYAALFGIWLGQGSDRSRIKEFLSVYGCASLCTSLVSVCRFGSLSPIGVALNPVFAPLLSFISCQMGLSGIAVFWLRLDPHAYSLRVVRFLLHHFKEIVRRLAVSPGAYLECAGMAQVFFCLILGALVALLLARRVRTILLKYNL